MIAHVETETRCQCSECHRMHDGHGQLLAFQPCVPVIVSCGLADCAAVIAANDARERERQQRRRRTVKAPPADARGCHRGMPPEDERDYGAPVVMSQTDFERSGAADSQDARAIKFFSDPKTHGHFFPLPYLMEISGSPNFHNRAIAVRHHFEPLGFGLWNEMRPFGPTGALHSHYALLPLADVQHRERERDDKRARHHGQKTLSV